MTSRPALLLVPILALAALLRFTALDWGLRHVPHQDERSFVDNVARMLAERDLDHRFYEYPGLFLYMLLPVQAAAGGSGPAAYHAARGLVAFFGVASVGLVGLLGFRLGGAALGLSAALLLAVSPLEVVTGHMVRPDIALETFALLAFLSFRGLGREPRGDLRAGAALGAAGSIKFTGVLLLPSYLLARLLAPGERLRGVLRAGLVAALLGVLFTPYAVLRSREFLRGADYQMAVHYKGQAPDAGYLDHAVTLLRAMADGLGPVAAVLALAGLGLALRREARRAWLPLLVYPLAIVLVMSSADLIYVRHVIPGLFVVALLAALPIHTLAARRPWLAALVALGAAALPLRTSWNYVGNISGTLPRDRVLDWAEARLPPGAVVLDTRPELGLGFDHARLEVVDADERRGPLDRLLAENVDAIVTGPGLARRWGPVITLFPAPGETALLHVKTVPPERRARYERVPLARARLSASHRTDRLPLLHDDRPATVWTSGLPQAPEQWVRVEFDAPVAVARIELVAGPERAHHAGDLRVWVSLDGREWRRSRDLSVRGPLEEQNPALRAPSQLLIVDPQAVRGLRIEIGSPWREPWDVAELRLDVRR
jgi:hypothetical protein